MLVKELIAKIEGRSNKYKLELAIRVAKRNDYEKRQQALEIILDGVAVCDVAWFDFTYNLWGDL